ncbi:MAG: sigma-70 family RNA polymerase sigma factor [Chloroflexia bacterium]
MLLPIGAAANRSLLDRLNDAQLMSAVAKGNTVAFEKLYERHVRRCVGFALLYVDEPSLAEDIVQEVFTKLWSRPETFSPARGAFHTWLLTVVRNQALDKRRQITGRSATHKLPLRMESARSDTIIKRLPDTAPTPHDQAWTKHVADVVRHAIRQLPVSEYQTITLAYFSDLTQREIANRLHQPLGTVKTRTRSAMRHLHYLLCTQSALLD